MNVNYILKRFEELGNPNPIKYLERYGIKARNAYAVRVPELRMMAKQIKTNHILALELWDTDIHDAKLLAPLIADPKKLNDEFMENWAADFYSWDTCDVCISNLFWKFEKAWEKAIEWSTREEEFVKRAGFVMMAVLAVKDKKAQDDKFREFYPLIMQGSTDERNFVKKAVNWAIRQIGKRNLNLNRQMLELSKEVKALDSKSARWIASDAIRELESEAVIERLKKKEIGK